MEYRIHLFPASGSAMMWASSPKLGPKLSPPCFHSHHGLPLLRLWAKITPSSLFLLSVFVVVILELLIKQRQKERGLTLGLFSLFLKTVPSRCKKKVLALLIKAQDALCGRQQASGTAGSDGRLGDLSRRSAILLPKRHMPYLWVMLPSSSSSGWYNETWSENSWWTA